MRSTFGWTFIAALALATSARAGDASTSDRDRAALEARLASLEAEVHRLEAARAADASLTAARAQTVRALVQDVLTDADTRTALLEGPSSGWDGHPFLASADGAFRVEIEGRLQLRYVFNVQENAPGIDTSRGGFEARRIRYIFSGHVVDPSITYKIQGTYSRSSGVLALEDAFVEKEFDNGMSVRIGQFRPGFTRESNVSTFRTTAVERSLAHGAIQLGRTQGIEVAWSNDVFSVQAGFHDGEGLANSPALMADTEFAFAGRAEWLVAGNWRQFRDFTSWRGEDFGLLLGAGASYQRGEFGTAMPGRADDVRWTFDASAEFGGAHLYGAVGGRNLDPDAGPDVDVLVAVLQGGVFVTNDIEVFGRFEWGDDDSADDLILATAGITKHWSEHALKWTTDIGYAFEQVSDTFASSGAGWRTDSPGNDGQLVFRTQLQLTF